MRWLLRLLRRELFCFFTANPRHRNQCRGYPLHHAEYRTKYAENLKRELPRVPLVGARHSEERSDQESAGKAATEKQIPRSARNDSERARNDSEWARNDGSGTQDDSSAFWAFANAGKELANLHVDYEKLEPCPLKFVETGVVAASLPRHGGVKPPLRSLPLSYRVEDKMRLSKDRKSLKVNDTLTLGGIPPEAFEYRLGNRSALEWVIDQYRVKEDKHSGIRSDPNRADDPEYIVRLVGQVVRVSLETVRIVNSRPSL